MMVMAKVKVAAVVVLMVAAAVGVGIAAQPTTAPVSGATATKSTTATIPARAWTDMVAVRAAQEQAVESIQYTYDFEVIWGGEAPPNDKISYTATVIRSGRKVFLQVNGTGGVNKGDVLTRTRAFDGSVIRERLGNPPVFGQGRAETMSLEGFPAPMLEAEPVAIGKLDSEIREGKASLQSIEDAVTPEGVSCKKVSIIRRDGKDRLEIWYDPNQGYFPLLFNASIEEGRVRQQTEKARYTRIERDGHVFFYPLSASLVHLKDGAVTGRLSFKMHDGSIRINEEIPSERFYLKAEPGEPVWDKELRTWINDGSLREK